VLTQTPAIDPLQASRASGTVGATAEERHETVEPLFSGATGGTVSKVRFADVEVTVPQLLVTTT
jgi:hypothetical protein